MGTKLVAVKLTETEHKALSQLVLFGRCETLSDGLRQGLMLLLDVANVRLETKNKIRMERIRHPMRRPKQPKDEA